MPSCKAFEVNGCLLSATCGGPCWLTFPVSGAEIWNGACDTSGNQRAYRKLYDTFRRRRQSPTTSGSVGSAITLSILNLFSTSGPLFSFDAPVVRFFSHRFAGTRPSKPTNQRAPVLAAVGPTGVTRSLLLAQVTSSSPANLPVTGPTIFTLVGTNLALAEPSATMCTSV